MKKVDNRENFGQLQKVLCLLLLIYSRDFMSLKIVSSKVSSVVRRNYHKVICTAVDIALVYP